MRRSSLIVAGGLVVLTAGPAVAQEFKPPANFFAQQKKPTPKPEVDWNWRPSPDGTSPAKATVVCGMTLVPADPKVDPGIRVAAPDSRVSYTLRSVQPAICKGR